MRQVDVAIIGGGPAGLIAAIELTQASVKFVLIDAYPQLGGQYFMQSPREFEHHAPFSHGRQAEYESLISSLEQCEANILRETAVWSIFPSGGTEDGYTLYLQGSYDLDALQARYLLLAPGAYDRPMVFPGWHLPGVLTPGAAQILLKGHGIRPARRALVAGSGPLLLAATAGLAEAGTEVVAVLDVASMWDGFGNAPQALWGQKARLKELWQYGTTLIRNRIPLRFGHAVFRALGETELTAVAYGRVDDLGRPLPETEKVVNVDTLCVGLGFLPNLALTRHLGCNHVYDEALDAFYPEHDATMETTVPGVFVAGDVTGVGGKDMAMLQGKVAGLNILGMIGRLTPAQVKERFEEMKPYINREARFIRMLRGRLRMRPGLSALVDDNTVICRCEMVNAGQISAAIAEGGHDIRGIKLRTRCGMGSCQGRYCEANVAQLIATAIGQPREAIGTMSVRPPLIPVLIADLVE